MNAFTSMFAWRALDIKRTLGVRTAAGYLRNRQVKLADALLILVGRQLPRIL